MTSTPARLRTALTAVVVLGTLLLVAAASAATVPKGQPDPTFGTGGIASLGSGTRLFGTAVQSDGKVVAVGANGYGGTVHLLVVRFTSTGALDSSFSGGQVTGPANAIGHAVAIQPDGKIVVAGQLSDASGASEAGMFVERFNSNGSVDSGFGSGGVAESLAGDTAGTANAVALQGDGKIVIAGSGTIAGGQNQGFPSVALSRFNTNGTHDSSFGSGGTEVVDLGRLAVANGMAIQSDGKIVIGGSQRQGFQATSALAARFNTNGSDDTKFSGGIFLQEFAQNAAYSAFNAVAIQPDGKVVLAGSANNGSTGTQALVVRLTSGGAFDGTFGSGGTVRLADAATPGAACSGAPLCGALGVVVSGGEIFAAGWFDNQGGHELALWGLNGNGTLDSGFGTAGVALVPGGSTQIQGNALAVAPGGNLVVAGERDAVFSATASGFVGRFGGQPVTTPPPPPPSSVPRVAIFGHTGFVASSGEGGIFLGCFGTKPCTGSMTVTVGSTVIGSRSSETISPNDGGIVHFSLSSKGRSMLAHARHNQLAVRVTVKDTGGGNTASSVVTLVEFSTSGAAPASSLTRSSTVALFGHTGFVSKSGVGGVFVGCFGTRSCTGALTISVGHTVIGSRSSETVSPNNGGIVHVSLTRHGQSLMSHAHGNQLSVHVVVKDTDGATTTGTMNLVRFRG